MQLLLLLGISAAEVNNMPTIRNRSSNSLDNFYKRPQKTKFRFQVLIVMIVGIGFL